MKKVYKSKVALWLVVAIVVVVIISIMPLLIIDFSWIPVAVAALIIACALYYMYSITYVVESGTLTVICGFWQKTQYDIGEINKIKCTTVTESAPAASLDRIAIYFNNQRAPLIISPENKEEFIKDLKAINPDIVYKRD